MTESPSRKVIEGRSEGSRKNVQPSSQHRAEAQHFPLHDAQLDKPEEHASRKRGRRKRPPKHDSRELFKRREVSVSENLRPCSCSDLPEYFTRDPNHVPRLKDWPVGKLEFLEHVKQISTCRGHPLPVVSACRKILRENRYPEQFPSTGGRNDSGITRAQSSIAPSVFYGKRSGRQPDPSTGSSVHHQPRQNSNTKCSPSKALPKALPIRNQSTAAQIHGVSSLSQSSKFASHPHGGENLLSGQENVSASQTSKILPEASSVLDRPQRPFDAHRQRHQSAPVNVASRNIAVGDRDRDRLLPPTLHRHDTALQEISNNVIFQRLERRMDEFQRVILERLPATAPTQVAALGPVSAAAANVTAPAQGGNGAEQAPPRRRWKKPSYAERQMKNPKLDRNVPEHLVHTDDEIVEIGRVVNAYERHVEAPEAFDWSGRLYAKYKRLLVRSVDGVPVWTAEEISRVTR